MGNDAGRHLDQRGGDPVMFTDCAGAFVAVRCPVEVPSRAGDEIRTGERALGGGHSIGSMAVRTVLQRGPKAKKAVAFALDWPGWSRGANAPDLALETFLSYRERYRPIAVAAGMAKAFDAGGRPKVIEDQVGTGSTDFW